MREGARWKKGRKEEKKKEDKIRYFLSTKVEPGAKTQVPLTQSH